MARAVISKTKMLLLSSCRETSRPLRCHFSSSTAEHQPEKSGNPIERSKMEDWLPHPRTGIYVPKGHEWVMDDVPENAASFSQTYWLRDVDGVEKPIHCLATNLYPASQEGLHDQVLACCDDN